MASTSIAPSNIKTASNKKQGMDKYEIESAARTLMDAQDIQADPHKMKHVAKHAKDQRRKLASLTARGLISEKAEAKMKGKAP